MPKIVLCDRPFGIACILYGLVHGFSAAVGTPLRPQVAVSINDDMDGFACTITRYHSLYDVCAIDAIRKEGEDLDDRQICPFRKG